LSGTTERQIKGWAPASATIEYSGATEAVRVALSGAYGEEVRGTSLTPGTISDTGDEVPGHGTQFKINGIEVAKLQSATLTFENVSRLIRGADQKPVDAVAGNVSESADVVAIYDGSDLYELALGTGGTTTIQSDPDEVSATVTFDVDGSTVADYTGTVAPDSYDWADLVNPDANLTENVAFLMRGITGSDPTA